MSWIPTRPQEAHSRDFPAHHFYPSAIRPISRSDMDALFLNQVFGTAGTKQTLRQIRDTLRTEVLSGDTRAVDRAMDVIDQAIFTSTQGYTGNTSTVLRMTHPEFGRVFTPRNSFGAERWIGSFLSHSGLSPQDLEILGETAVRARGRQMNVLERAVHSALLRLKPEEPEQPAGPSTTPEGRPAFPTVHTMFGSMIRGLLPASVEAAQTMDPEEAQEILFDARALYEVFFWLYWVQLHANAHEAVQALKTGQSPSTTIQTFLFGYETEGESIAGRPFATERKRLEDILYSGSLALNALSALHLSADLSEAHWFTELDSLRKENDEGRITSSLDGWLTAYEKLVAATESSNEPKTIEAGLVSVYEAIRLHFQPMKPNQKYPYTVGFGVARQAGQGENCQLLINLGVGRNRGLTTMFDLDLLLTFARALSRRGDRVRWSEIRDVMERVGIVIDEHTERAIIEDLEARGLVRALSDSGEAIYVEIH